MRSSVTAAAALAAGAGRALAWKVQTTRATRPAEHTLGWALVGLGGLSRGQLLPALDKTRCARLTAVVTGHAEKLDEPWAKSRPEQKRYTNETFDQLKDNPEVDVVYIVLPNGMHAEYTIRAAGAGKHVFCEKPMATSVADCRRMIDACRAAGKRLSIAYRMAHDPNLLEARRLVRDGAIGKVTALESHFGFNMRGPNWRLSKQMAGGGPLMDVGIYSVNAVRFVLGDNPVSVVAKIPEAGKDDPRFKEVEPAMNFTLSFGNGVEARCRTAYNANLGTMLRIIGERGTILMEPAFMYWGNRMTIQRDGKIDVITKPNIDQFAAEMDDFSRSILDDRPSPTPGEEGMRDMQVIEALYRSAAQGRPVNLA